MLSVGFKSGNQTINIVTVPLDMLVIDLNQRLSSSDKLSQALQM